MPNGSKRGSKRGGKAGGKRSKGKRAAMGKTRRRPFVMQKGGNVFYTALPVARQYSRIGGNFFSFDKAPKHDTYGDGMRIHCKCTPYDLMRISSAAVNAIFKYTASGPTTQYHSILSSCPRKHDTDSSSLWGSSEITSTTIETMFTLFSQFAVRFLRITYNPGVFTQVSGQVAIGVVKNRKGFSAEETTLSTISALQDSFVTPFYKKATLVAIKDDMSKPAMYLFDTMVPADYKYSIEHQFSVIGAVGAQTSSGTEEQIGTLEVEFVIDLYQVRGVAQVVEPPVFEENKILKIENKKLRELLALAHVEEKDEKGEKEDEVNVTAKKTDMKSEFVLVSSASSSSPSTATAKSLMSKFH